MKQFIHGLNDNNILVEIICKLTAIKDTSAVTSEKVLAWARHVEAQSTQTVVLDSLRDKGLWCV